MKQLSPLFSGILFMILICTFSSCKEQLKEIIPSDDFAPYVSAYTGGVISSTANIYIELAQTYPDFEENEEVSEKLFSFTPALKGKAYWIDQQTIQFVPDSGALKPGTLYNATFALGKVMPVEKNLTNFNFSFRIQERNFTARILSTDISLSTPDLVTVVGEIRLSDFSTEEILAKMISIKGGNNLTPLLSPTPNPYLYKFEIKDIEKKRKEEKLEIIINGKPFGATSKETEALYVTIPAKDNFTFLGAEYIETPDRQILLTFSNPVSPTQMVRGLIESSQIHTANFLVSDNKISIFITENVINRKKPIELTITDGLKDYNDNYLDQNYPVSLEVNPLKPKVELLTSGTILPNSENLLLPFRAVSLKAVDVSVIKIFENNILMFLQDNNLDDSYIDGLRRAGRLVYKDRIRLDNDPTKNINEWDNYFLDLSKIIDQDPGAIYRIQFSFDQSCSAYPCSGSTPIANDRERLTKYDAKTITESEDAVWDKASTYYHAGSYLDWDVYNWRERENPCHPSYYMVSDRMVSTNVMASSIGVIAKSNATNNLWISVSDIITTQPLENATISIYNFQLQLIGKTQTDRNGFAEIKVKNKPFVLIAESGNQKTYLKLNDGQENMLSRFDIGGEILQKGLKGFVYGERGVWRPGDTIFISFMLEDRENRIPDHHPVSFELYNPQGQFYHKQVSTDGLNGLYTFKVATRENDPTGGWNAYVKVGGSAFHKAIRIETIKPNRLKINIDFEGDKIKQGESGMPVKIHASWLTGAIAKDLKAALEFSLVKSGAKFKGYERFNFTNPVSRFKSGDPVFYEGLLDDNGNVTFNVDIPSAKSAPGMLDAHLICRVFEKGGDISIFSKSVPYSPYESYVGIDLKTKGNWHYLETDKDHIFDIVTLDADGKPISNNEVDYMIYRVGWNWWYEYDSYSMANFIQNRSNIPVESGTVKTMKGRGKIKFRVDYPQWGRYFIYVVDRKSGHATGGFVLIDWPSWRGRSSKDDPTSLKMITLATDKENYEVNDHVTVIIPASEGGRALVALENGTQVLHREWVRVNENSETKYIFKADPSMSPNVYVHVSLLQPHEQTVNDLPIRMYGIVPVFIHNKSSKLAPQITAPEVIHPEKEFTVKVKEQHNAPMTYTLAIVDEGLLDITNFKTPDPWNCFFAREALGIKTWDMYDLVIGAHTGSLGSMLSIGGDEGIKRPDPKANRFKPVVKFLGPFTLKKGEEKLHKITLPPYIGSVRIMVVAGQEGAYGNAEKTVPVRSPLMILSSLPRVISTDEKISLPVNVFAMEKEVKNIMVKVETTGKLKVADEGSKTVSFEKPGDQIVDFVLQSGMTTGVEKITITATGNGKTVTESIEIDIRNPNPPVVDLKQKLLNPGESIEIPYTVMNSDDSWAKLEISRIPFVDLSRRFDFLYNYDHCCTEQLVSKALPLLYMAQFREVDDKEKIVISSSVREAIQSLYARQAHNGGFVYWPGMSEVNSWVTSYAGLFLLEAKEKGYEVNAEVLNKWKQYQKSSARSWRTTTSSQNTRYYYEQSALTQSFRLYTLAFADEPEKGAMNRMKEMSDLDLATRWRLSATYALAGNKKVAQELVKDKITTVSEINIYTYGSLMRDEAMILEALLLLDRKEDAFKQARNISERMSKEYYFSTQSTAFALMAMGKLAEKMSGILNFEWSIAPEKSTKITSSKTIFQQDLSVKRGEQTAWVKNTGDGTIYVSLVSRYIPKRDSLPARNSNIKMTVKYEDMNGKEISVDKLRQGTDFYAVVEIANMSATSHYTNLALTHIVPSGWEIYNERLLSSVLSGKTTTPQKSSSNYYDDYDDEYGEDEYYEDYADNKSDITYQDIRDDRILSYFDLRRGQSITVRVRLTASYSGEYILPAIQCEAMYDAEVFTRNKAGRVKVEK